MAIELSAPRSRRSLLTTLGAAAVGAVAATATGVQRVLGAGNDGAIIHVGDEYYDVHARTVLKNPDTDSILPVLILAHFGVVPALRAEANNVAVSGYSVRSNGVVGSSGSSVDSGVYGENYNKGFGVGGRSNAGPLVNGSIGSGVYGENVAGGVGVWARSAHGVALLADPYDTGAIAFRAKGVAQFVRSGRLTVKTGTASVTKTGIRVDPGTLVLAVLQQDRPGVYVRSAVPDAAGARFTVRLNKAVTSDTKVGWFLVN